MLVHFLNRGVLETASQKVKEQHGVMLIRRTDNVEILLGAGDGDKVLSRASKRIWI
jgi:hypothetical protein